MIPKNWRADSIVSNFNFTEPTRGLLQQNRHEPEVPACPLFRCFRSMSGRVAKATFMIHRGTLDGRGFVVLGRELWQL